MPLMMEEYARGAEAGAAPETTLAKLAQTKAVTRAQEQQNEIRQLEVDATKKLGELTTYAEPTTPIGGGQPAPALAESAQAKDLPFAYKQVSAAHQAYDSAKQEEEQALSQMKAAQNTSRYDNYKEAYKFAQEKTASAKAEQQKLVENQLNEVLSPALAIQPNGAGYDQFKNSFVDHYVAAGIAQGVPPTEVERMRRDAMSQMPSTWGPQAKAFVEHYAKSLRDYKESMEIDKRFMEKQKEENDRIHDKEMADAMRVKADLAVNKQGSVDNAIVLKDLEKEQQTKTVALGALRQEQARLHKLIQANPADEEVSVQLADVEDKVKSTEGYINSLSSQIALQREIVARTPNKPSSVSVVKHVEKGKSSSYKTADEVKAAYKAGSLTKDEAKQHLKQFGY